MLIIELSTSKVDRNGNRHHVARIMNKETGKQVWLDIDGPSFLRMSLPILFGSPGRVESNCHVYETTIPIRSLRSLRKHALPAG